MTSTRSRSPDNFLSETHLSRGCPGRGSWVRAARHSGIRHDHSVRHIAGVRQECRRPPAATSASRVLTGRPAKREVGCARVLAVVQGCGAVGGVIVRYDDQRIAASRTSERHGRNRTRLSRGASPYRGVSMRSRVRTPLLTLRRAMSVAASRTWMGGTAVRTLASHPRARLWSARHRGSRVAPRRLRRTGRVWGDPSTLRDRWPGPPWAAMPRRNQGSPVRRQAGSGHEGHRRHAPPRRCRCWRESDRAHDHPCRWHVSRERGAGELRPHS